MSLTLSPNQAFGEEWSARFGDIMKPCNRHDVKLGLEAAPVRYLVITPLVSRRRRWCARLLSG